MTTASSLKTVGIDHVVLHVSDVERSKAFYVGLLGMSVAHEGGGHTFLHCGEQVVALFQAPAGKSLEAGVDMNHLALRLDSGERAAVKATLETHGCTVSGRSGDPNCIYFNDPDGHRLQLLLPGEH